MNGTAQPDSGHARPGDVLAFKLGDILPAGDPLSEWLTLLAMALNDVALVNDRLERDFDTPYEYLYWLRLGIGHFYEGARLLETARDIPEVQTYLASLQSDVRDRYHECLAIWTERRGELVKMRDLLFHYLSVYRGTEPITQPALEALAGDTTTMRTGTIREMRLLFADDVVAAVFAYCTGVPSVPRRAPLRKPGGGGARVGVLLWGATAVTVGKTRQAVELGPAAGESSLDPGVEG